MADEKTAPENEQAAGSKKAGLLDNKVFLLGGIFVILQVVMALVITQFVIVPKLGVQGAAMGQASGAESADAKQNPMGIIVGLEEIIVTLQSDGDIPNYLRINVNLDVVDQKTADIVAARLPQLRDVVILTLASKKANDLITPAGNLAVRKEIFSKLAEKLPGETLQDIYFSDLVIQ